MKLYHVSLEVGNIIKEFKPRIPSIRLRDGSEDDKVRRICVSASINGCLSAVSWGGLSFENICIDYNMSIPIRVYEFDTNDIAPENLIYPKHLYETDKVRDAEINQEYWIINQNIKPRNTYLIKIRDYDELLKDDISYKNLILCEENENEYVSDYIEGCFTVIEAECEVIDDNDIIYSNCITIPISREYIEQNKLQALKSCEYIADIFVPDDIRREGDFASIMRTDNGFNIQYLNKYGFLKSALNSIIKEEFPM